MFFKLHEVDINGFILNPAYRSMRGETFLSQDSIDVESLVGTLPEHIGYRLVLNWTVTVENQFNGDIVLVAAGVQEIYFTPDGNNDFEKLQRAISQSQEGFTKELLKMLIDTPLQNIMFGEIDYAELAQNVMEYVEQNIN